MFSTTVDSWFLEFFSAFPQFKCWHMASKKAVKGANKRKADFLNGLCMLESLPNYFFLLKDCLFLFDGILALIFNIQSVTFYTEPPKVLPLTFGQDTVDEGEFTQVICIVSKGDEPLTLGWSLHGAVISSEPTISTNMLGGRTSMLTIRSVGYRHSGLYTCTAQNEAGVSSSSVQLKVNG